MSIIKSFSVGEGDMFYIKHNSSNFSIIDCCLDDDNKNEIVDEIISEFLGKDIIRFISTHPDQDHIEGLKYLDERIGILNFYCVKNSAIKTDKTEDFKHYCKLRDGNEHYYVYKDCKRKWMNQGDEERGCSGINYLWPDETNLDYKEALKAVSEGHDFNNISTIFTYSLENGVVVMWMGDIEHEFLEKIKDEIFWPKIDILFAPHHGRESGKVPSDILNKLEPSLIVIGEAPSKYLNYYSGYNTITQNTAKDIVFDCENGKVHIYISNDKYNYDTSFLENENMNNEKFGAYLGTLKTKEGNE